MALISIIFGDRFVFDGFNQRLLVFLLRILDSEQKERLSLISQQKQACIRWSDHNIYARLCESQEVC